MATLDHFLRTGQLGEISLGMNPFDVESILGEPTDRSRKSNPLELCYGPLRLTFWKHRDSPRPQLMGIDVEFRASGEELPAAVRFTDVDMTQQLSLERFRSHLHDIQYLPIHLVARTSGTELVFPSNVVAQFIDGRLHHVRISQQRTREKTPAPLSGLREPLKEDILAMIAEARELLESGHERAALLLAWAGLEAVLRRIAIGEGYTGRIDVQANILLRELASARLIAHDDLAWLEQMRQLRTSVAHGLAPEPIDGSMIARTIAFSQFLLSFRETV